MFLPFYYFLSFLLFFISVLVLVILVNQVKLNDFYISTFYIFIDYSLNMIQCCKVVDFVYMVLTLQEGYDFVMDVSSDGSLLHLLVRSSNSTVADVISNVVIKQDGILRYDANVSAQRGLLHLRHNQTYHI